MRKIAAALAVLALAACGGGGQAAPTVTTVATSAPESSPAPTPTEKVASTQQYASLVAQTKPSLEQTFTNLEGCMLVADTIEMPCSAYVLTIGLQASTVKLQLEGAGREGVPAYIGKPPAEIEQLVLDTVASAGTVEEKAKALSECTAGCSTLGGELFQALVPFKSTLAGWKPYGA